MQLNHSLENLFPYFKASPKIELEWVDVLSQLEYVGCRKIIKSVGFDAMNGQVLKHLTEEAMHAYLLKSAAEASGLPVRPWTEGLFCNLGFEYIRDLDAGISELQKNEGDCYPAVSWTLETRVLSLYPAYDEVCQFSKVKKAIGVILAQEKAHALQFKDLSLTDMEKGNLLRLEESLWSRFMEKSLNLLRQL